MEIVIEFSKIKKFFCFLNLADGKLEKSNGKISENVLQ